ncbi:MAG: ribose-phosphate diphosphokinase [Myxococcota bacterium]
MTSPSRAPLTLLACQPAVPLSERVAAHLGETLRPLQETWFACGEGKAVLPENVRGTDVYIIQSAIGPGDPHSVYDRFVMLLHAVEAAALADADHITAVLPYYPGARQDKRKGRTREGIAAGLFARCLEAAGAQRVITLEIHNSAIGGMFDPRRCSLENVLLEPSLSSWLLSQGIEADVVVSPDVGGLERARAYAQTLNLDLAMLSKVRDTTRANHIVNATLIGDVQDKNVLLIDDIVDTAGSVVTAVRRLWEGGAKDVTISCAHALLSDPAPERLERLHQDALQRGTRVRLISSTSIERHDLPVWHQQFDLAPLLARVIRSVNTRGSVTGAQAGS